MSPRLQASKVVTPELHTALTTRTDLLLSYIVTANATSQFASQTPALVRFRDAVATHGGMAAIDTATLLRDFRDHVPLTDYDMYRPWIARFEERPCTEAQVRDLFAPGLPSYIFESSSTSGKASKAFPAYQFAAHDHPAPRPINPQEMKGPRSAIFYLGYRDIREVESEPGHVIKRIPVCLASAGRIRMLFGLDIDSDESRLSNTVPTHVVPWGAYIITHYKSFLVIHALFSLACRDLDQLSFTFIVFFVDFVHYIEEEWDMLLASIEDGTIPDIDGIDHLRSHLQVSFGPNQTRVNELREVGPPSLGSGWAARVWPHLRRLEGVCTGAFKTSLPQVRAILGPTITVRSYGYGSSESSMSVSFNDDGTDSFVFETDDVVEFVGVEEEGPKSKILQGWELDAGKRYLVVVTTRSGLWRYLLDDTIEIVGFSPENGSPVFKFIGRKNSVIRLPSVAISDPELVEAVQVVSSEEYIQVLDFTSIIDDRQTSRTIGFLVELSGQPGPNANKASQRISEILAAGNDQYRRLAHSGDIRSPTIRVVEPGTFTEYRRWRCEKMGVGLGQVKVPVVMSLIESQEWMLKRVIQEL